MDDEKAPATPPAEPTTPVAEPASAAPAAEPRADEPTLGEGEDKMVMAPNVESDVPVVTKVHKKRFAKFDSLWESVKRTFSGEEHEGGVIPAGAVNRRRHREPRVFFVDTGNVSASQFAEAFALQEGLHAESGGTFPAGDISAEALSAMDEKG
ncbi:MAG: hypothetical protein QOJ26_1305, partial [Thermoplasmata archaeon]|nr:hypothetical protein [Thermoplasmata archaeon]